MLLVNIVGNLNYLLLLVKRYLCKDWHLIPPLNSTCPLAFQHIYFPGRKYWTSNYNKCIFIRNVIWTNKDRHITHLLKHFNNKLGSWPRAASALKWSIKIDNSLNNRSKMSFVCDAVLRQRAFFDLCKWPKSCQMTSSQCVTNWRSVKQ